jgi:hypothetical protein
MGTADAGKRSIDLLHKAAFANKEFAIPSLRNVLKGPNAMMSPLYKSLLNSFVT